MNITVRNIDGGKTFDWGRTSADYARFRDISDCDSRCLSGKVCTCGIRYSALGDDCRTTVYQMKSNDLA